MKRTEVFIGRLLKYGTLLSTYGLVLTVLLQIFARFFLNQAPAWTEEASRLFFIYGLSFAAGLALKNQYYVHWDLMYNKLPARGKRFLDIGIPLLIFLLFGTMAAFSIPLMIQGFAETSPSMRMNMAFAFFSMFLMSAGICFYASMDLRKTFFKPKS